MRTNSEHHAKDSAGQIAMINDYNLTKIVNSFKENGALIIRGGDPTVEDFEALSKEFMVPMVHHSISTIERDIVNADATTSTVNKGMDAIPLHREGSYAPGCPDILMLYCVKPSDRGGETVVCDGVHLLETLPDRVRNFVDATVLKWQWEAPRERWQSTLRAKTKDEALTRLEQIKSKFAVWEDFDAKFEADRMYGSYKTLCAIPTKWGNKRAFCNSLLIYHFREASEYYARELFSLTLDDGSPFPMQMLKEISEYAERAACNVTWQPCDILLIDNSRFMHGRRVFSDTSRRILIRMGHIPEGKL